MADMASSGRHEKFRRGGTKKEVTMKYGWKGGSRHTKHDAQRIGEHLEKIREREGYLTAEIILRDAHKKRSPIHKLFEWDDTEAAVQHRLSQARSLTRSVVIIVEGPKGELDPIRAFVHIGEPQGGHYTSLHVAMSDEDLRNQVLDRARDELDIWQKRYQDFVEFAEIYRAIEKSKVAA